MGVSQILDEIKSLPLEQRWEILERTREMLDDLPVSAEEIELLNKRRAAHRLAPDEALPLEEFKRQLAERL